MGKEYLSVNKEVSIVLADSECGCSIPDSDYSDSNQAGCIEGDSIVMV